MTIKELFSDIRILVCEVMGLDRAELITNENAEISQPLLEEIKDVIDERLSSVPVAYILSHKEFYKNVFSTPQGVLIPQPDSEVLVECALEYLDSILSSDSEFCILDLCAGTGCIGISVAKEISLRTQGSISLYLSDISSDAYNCFSFNADQILYGTNVNVYRICADLYEGITDSEVKFDLICANPPYIRTAVLSTLSEEVLKQPEIALDGGEDGLDVIRRIVESAPDYLKHGGCLSCEIGFDMAEEVVSLFKKAGFSNINVSKDLGGNDRVVSGICTKN